MAKAFSGASVGKRQRKVKTLRRMDVVDWIETKSKGRIFGVDLIKRTDGSKRYMVCRWGVRSHLKGGVLPYNAKEKRLTIVFDIQRGAYRAIAWEGIRGILRNGEYFKVI